MTDRSIRSVQCTSCGAPLTLHGGGHKIRTLNCEFCGAVMDARKHYKVLAKFSDQQAPYTPFKLGMQGKIHGIEFIITGIVGWDDEGYSWVDMQLFSPTHGYAWLTYYRAHLLFLRRTRLLPNRKMNLLMPGQKVQAGTRSYRIYESGNATITYVAGELTWVARVGDRSQYTEAVAPPYLLSVERSKTEYEYTLGEYLPDPDAVYDSFSATPSPYKRSEIHPAQPYSGGKFFEPAHKASKPFVIISLILLIMVLLFSGGKKVYEKKIGIDELSASSAVQTFTLKKPALMKLELDANTQQAWQLLDIYLQKGDLKIYPFADKKSSAAMQPTDLKRGDKSQAEARFRLQDVGKYTLNIRLPNGSPLRETKNQALFNSSLPVLTVKLYQGYTSPRYFVILLIAFLLMLIANPVKRWLFEIKRWRNAMGGG